METQLIGTYKLPNGDSVWAVHRVTQLPDLSRAFPAVPGQFFKGKTQDDLKGYLRAIALGKEPDGSRVIYDFAVQRRSL
jgi:hypothetical protein